MSNSQPKRVLVVTRNFPPLTGGMERLNYHLYLELEKEFEVSIAGPEGCQHYLMSHTSSALFLHKPLSLFLLKSLIVTYRLAVKKKPDLIIAGSGVTSITALLAGRRVGAKVMTFLHGLDILYPHPIYQFLFLRAIRACDGVWVNSNHTAQLALQKGITPNKISVLHPGVTLPTDKELEIDPKLFKKLFAIKENRILLLSVGRLTERKGLPEFIQNCLPELSSNYPDILLVIIGDEPSEALSKQSGVTRRINQAVLESSMENHVLMLGKITENELFLAYASSELLVFPVLDLPGDVEGFGMVAIEAAAHGLPTAAFAVGGVTDAVKHEMSGWLVKSGDYATLGQTISHYLSRHQTPFEGKVERITLQNCRQFAAQFTWKTFGEKLKSTCHNLL